MVDPQGLSARYTILKHLLIIYRNVHSYFTLEWYYESLQSPERFLAVSGLSGKIVTPFVLQKRLKLNCHWNSLVRTALEDWDLKMEHGFMKDQSCFLKENKKLNQEQKNTPHTNRTEIVNQSLKENSSVSKNCSVITNRQCCKIGLSIFKLCLACVQLASTEAP